MISLIDRFRPLVHQPPTWWAQVTPASPEEAELRRVQTVASATWVLMGGQQEGVWSRFDSDKHRLSLEIVQHVSCFCTARLQPRGASAAQGVALIHELFKFKAPRDQVDFEIATELLRDWSKALVVIVNKCRSVSEGGAGGDLGRAVAQAAWQEGDAASELARTSFIVENLLAMLYRHVQFHFDLGNVKGVGRGGRGRPTVALGAGADTQIIPLDQLKGCVMDILSHLGQLDDICFDATRGIDAADVGDTASQRPWPTWPLTLATSKFVLRILIKLRDIQRH